MQNARSGTFTTDSDTSKYSTTVPTIRLQCGKADGITAVGLNKKWSKSIKLSHSHFAFMAI